MKTLCLYAVFLLLMASSICAPGQEYQDDSSDTNNNIEMRPADISPNDDPNMNTHDSGTNIEADIKKEPAQHPTPPSPLSRDEYDYR